MNNTGTNSVWQPILEDENVLLRPLQQSDFEELYKVASDPLIWEQHPNPDRYKREVFQNYFSGAMESGGAFAVYDVRSGELIGSTRFYDYDASEKKVLIGYTFIARKFWGGVYNRAMKKLMMDYAFRYVDTVIYHIGANNMRSRKAMEKLGGKLVGSESVAYYGEKANENCVYQIDKKDWTRLRATH